MDIKSSSRPKTSLPTQNPSSPAKSDSEPKADLTFKDIVTKGAYTTGGALGGTGLGVATGLALSNVSGNPIFGQFGGIAGAVGGAAAGFVASQNGVSKENLARSVGSWVGSSMLSSAGMWAVGSATSSLAAHGASAVLGANGALIGAVAGGLIGAAVPFIGSEGRITNGLKDAATAAAGGTAGVVAGAGIQALAMKATNISSLPQFGLMLGPVPMITAAAGALTLLDIKYNPGYSPDHPNLRKAKHTSWSAAVGYGAGALVGSAATDIIGASGNYLAAAPAVGAIVGGLTCLGEYSDSPDNAYTKGAKTTLLTGLGTAAGDAIGHGLSALTGYSVYRDIGAAAGAVNGLTAGLRWSGIDDKKGLPVVTGLLSGGASGALLGAGISALSGQDIWQVVMPALGSATGLLTGLALSMHKES